GAAISELWRQTGLRGRDVRVGLSGSRVVVRVVDLPAMPDEEMAGAVRFSAADHIPIPLDEAVLDHAVLEPAPPTEPGGPPMVRVLVAAAHRSALDGLLAAVAAGGLRAVAVDLVPFALVRGLGNTTPAGDGGEPAAEAIVSVGAGLTTVVVHEGGRPRFVRTVPGGGEMLTAAVADEMGLDLEAAETAKRDGTAARIVELRLAGILGEIQSGLAYWMAQAERPLARIVLTGAGARSGDIAGRLGLLVGAPVEWGTVQGLEAPEPALGVGEWPDLAVAAGLALGALDDGWHIDFCPPVKRSFRFTGDMARRMAAAAAVTLVLLGGLSARSVLALSHERSQLAAQKKANDRVSAQIAQFNDLQGLSKDLDGARQRVQTALAGDVSWTRFLNGLVQAMPSGVWLQSLSAQATSPSPVGAAAPAAPTSGTKPAAGGKPAATAAPSGLGSLQVSANGVDFPAVADWLRQVGADPALAGVTVAGMTATATGPSPTVSFTSTGTITAAARSDRAAELTKAVK
ncbi:MAG TPA: pilus assembly protein PilM, partial [Acidimicrobiia bacterium]|nr:pilus assembly protein PilM [Acidimicrobiia bacterium]